MGASMKKVSLVSAITAAVSLSIAVAHADMTNGDNGEKCVPMKNGKNIVKASKNDCQTAAHGCAGQAKAGDVDSWINVPKGLCAKINSGDMSDVPQDIKDKLEI